MKRLAILAAVITLTLIALALSFLAYRRIGAPIQLMRGTVTVDGIITEKLVESQRLSPLPIDVPAYTIRYAFPNPQGQMRTGQQTVTRATYNRLGDQGKPATVTLSAADPTINAVDPRITFPSVAGIRLLIAFLCLLAAYFLFLFSFISPKSPHPVQDSELRTQNSELGT